MKALTILILLIFFNTAGTKEYSSITEVYTITIPDTWNVQVEQKRTEIYFKDDAYVGAFEIAIRPFLVKTNAKSEYLSLREDYKDAHFTRLNEVQVVICTLLREDEGKKEYNWIFYHDKYEVWCQYLVPSNSNHDDEVKQVQMAINSMAFFEID